MNGNTYGNGTQRIKMKMLEVPESISLLNSGLSSVFNMVIEKTLCKEYKHQGYIQRHGI